MSDALNTPDEPVRTTADRRTVRVVVDPHLDDLVAVKTGAGHAPSAAIEREALVLSQLRHPNVIEIVRTERDVDTVTLVTQFAGRSTLDEVEPTDATHVARIAASFLTIVADLHRMGWVHTRLTGDHCIVGPNGRLTLCGFDSAHRAPADDPRRAVDRRDALAIIAALADRLPGANDRVTRKHQRTLLSIMDRGTTTSGETIDDLRDEFSRLGGTPTVVRAAIDTDTTTRPAARTGGRAAGTIGRDDTAGTTVVRRRPGRSWKGAALSLAMLATMFGTIVFLKWIGGPLGDPLTKSTVQRIGDVPTPVRLALSIVRIVAFAACLYGIALSSAALAAIVTRRPDIEHLATAMAPPRLRRALVALIGLGVISSVATGPGSVAPRHQPPRHPTPRHATTTVTTTTAAVTTTAVTMTTTPTVVVHPASTSRPDPPPAEPPAPIPAESSAAAPALPNLWCVGPGDHLWSIAEATMERHLGRAATDREVDPYWRAVVDLNRASLLDPSDPDLVFIGQVIELPPIG